MTQAVDLGVSSTTRAFTVNEESFGGEDVFLNTFETGQLVEYEVESGDEHPFHVHVNPYQIAAIDPLYSTFYQVGDWHDTLFFDAAGSDTEFTVRQYATPACARDPSTGIV